MKDHRRVANEKPPVVVRKKVGKGRSPTGPTPLKPHKTLPATKTETPAASPPPLAQPRPPEAPPQPKTESDTMSFSEPTQPQPPEATPQPQSTAEAALSKSAERKRRRSEILDILRTRWPQTFPRDFREVKPWAIGIAKDVAKLLPDYPPLSVKDAISIYRLLATMPYCRALLQGGPRYGLDGNPCGEVTAEDQERAQRDLQAWYARRKQKAAAKAYTPRTEAPASA